MNKKILTLVAKAEKKYNDARCAVQRLEGAITYIGFDPEDKPEIDFIGGDGLCLIWNGREFFDWLELLDENNCIHREQLDYLERILD